MKNPNSNFFCGDTKVLDIVRGFVIVIVLSVVATARICEVRKKYKQEHR